MASNLPVECIANIDGISRNWSPWDTTRIYYDVEFRHFHEIGARGNQNLQMGIYFDVELREVHELGARGYERLLMRIYFIKELCEF